ncbi:MAG: hypothetical protein ACI9N1_000007 [Flavobacteriales bacterium]|jgi:hypothetical protein
MKNLITSYLKIIILMLYPFMVYSQGVGISNATIVADPSSILELRSTTQGLLVPRVTTVERDAIVSPADGLLIFNTSTDNFNFFKLGWQILGEPSYNTIDSGSALTSVSTSDVLITGMTLTPGAGTYIVNFNSQCVIPEAGNTTGFSTATAKADLNLIYTDITNMPVTDSTHALAFGSGETLTAGVYTLAGAISLAGNITLDGGGDPNAVFVIRSSGGAFAAGAGVMVNLTNGTKSSNVYWVSETASSVGAGSIFYGMLFSNSAAVAVGANSTMTGRLLTKSGAIAFGPGTLSVPTDPSVIDFRSVTNFVLFTGSGGISNTGASVYTGDIATDLGAITGFEDAIVNGTIFPAGSTTIVTPVIHVATFSLYQNGVLISNSERTRTHVSAQSDISLYGVSTVGAGETIEVRWRVDSQVSDTGGQVSAGNRILTLTKVQ